MGDAIPIGGRIIKVSDAIDAMLSDRPYRKALSLPLVEEQLLEFAGIQFDQAIISVVTRSSILDDHAAEIRRDLVPEAVSIVVPQPRQHPPRVAYGRGASARPLPETI